MLMNIWIIENNSMKLYYPRKNFCSHLNMEDITDADYGSAKRVREDFEIRNLVEYLDLYIQSNTLLLVDAFGNKIYVLKYMNLILLLFFQLLT